MMTTVLRRSISSVQRQCTPTVILQIGDSLARLTVRQARQLASVLVIQAEAIALAKTESADSLLADGWIAKPCSFRGDAHRKVLVACRTSKVMLRAAKRNQIAAKVRGRR
jgi:hypothetical protein